jgi:hypothetical protein
MHPSLNIPRPRRLNINTTRSESISSAVRPGDRHPFKFHTSQGFLFGCRERNISRTHLLTFFAVNSALQEACIRLCSSILFNLLTSRPLLRNFVYTSRRSRILERIWSVCADSSMYRYFDIYGRNQFSHSREFDARGRLTPRIATLIWLFGSCAVGFGHGECCREGRGISKVCTYENSRACRGK